MAEKIKETDILSNLVNIQKLYKDAKNTNLSNEHTQRFIDSIFNNYFLDNDNINFLTENGFKFFEFSDDELCFCLSGDKYENCCKKLIKTDKKSNYIPFLKAIIEKQNYSFYLDFSSQLFERFYEKLGKNEKCNFVNCENSAVENNLYNFNFKKNEFVSTNKRNIFDNNYEMGSVFFSKVTNNQFKYFGFCEEHYFLIQNLDLNKQSSDEDILILNFSALVYKLFIVRVQLQVLRSEFLDYFNSIEEENVKTLFIYNLKKVSNHVGSLIDSYSFFLANLKKETESYEILRFDLPKTKKFIIRDVFQPQITPDDFQVVNSVNNLFIIENFATIVVESCKNSTFATIVYNKKNPALQLFFKQYNDLMQSKTKNEAYFISNCSLILADNILFDKYWFESLSEEERVLYSALNKFRFQHPNMGQEYLKMKFFAGFTKGNNFF